MQRSGFMPWRHAVSSTTGFALLLAALHTNSVAASVAGAPMGTARTQHGGALLDDGSVAVFGGVNMNGFVSTSERWNGTSWTSLGITGITGNSTEAVTLGTGQVLVRSDGSLQARLYDPATNTWLDAGTQTVARSFPSMTLLANGKVLLAGGSNESSAELYDPVTRTWTATGSMSAPRRAHAAVLMKDGRVMVASGFNSGGEVPGAEIYDPAAGTWSAAAPPLTPRHYASLTLLPDMPSQSSGRLLLSGGLGTAGALAVAEIYSPTQNTWTATGLLNLSREGMMGSPLGHATVLPSGKVWAAGGSGEGVSRKTTELYDQTTGTWTSDDVIAEARENGTATLLPSGEVLLAGGNERTPSTVFFADTARYQPAVPAGTAAVLNAMPLLQRRGQALTFTGSGFGGPSTTSLPGLLLQRVENGQITRVDPQIYSTTMFQTSPLPTMPAGLYMARVVVDGVPSAAQLIRFTDPAGTPTGTAGDQQVQLSWTAPVDDRGNPPAGYEVSSSPGSAGCSTTAPTMQCTVTGLTNGVGYTFVVRARHPNGLGPVSSPSAAIQPVAGLSAPNNAAAVAGNTTADVTWQAPDQNGGSAITGYTVTAEQDGTKQCTTTGALGCTVPNLTNGTSYSFLVVAHNGVTDSPAATTNAVVPQGTQTIDFPQPPQQVLGETYAPQASATSNLPVSISVDGGVCTIASPGVVQFTDIGSCTLRASQAGDTATAAAPDVVRTFNVVAAATSGTPVPVPTLHQWGLMLLSLVLGAWGVRRQRVLR